jgi:hypothetical protein
LALANGAAPPHADRKMSAYRRFRFGVALLALPVLALTGCTVPGRSAANAPANTHAAATPAAKAKKGAARRAVPLSPGCPLGATAALGFNYTEKNCNVSARTTPAGPMGVPNAMP